MYVGAGSITSATIGGDKSQCALEAGVDAGRVLKIFADGMAKARGGIEEVFLRLVSPEFSCDFDRPVFAVNLRMR